MKSPLLFLLLFTILLGFSCNQDIVYESSSFYSEGDYAVLSEHLNLPDYPDSYVTNHANLVDIKNDLLATIGRVLFYDKDLSADGTISCASCHHQELAFSDDVNFSKGVNDNVTTRNSIALGSLSSFGGEYNQTSDFAPGLFWDERAPDVKAQMEETIANPVEMGMDLNSMTEIVQSKPYYQTLFNVTNFRNLGLETSGITKDNILIAIEAFVNSLEADKSKFDIISTTNDHLVGKSFDEDWRGFSEAENKGKALFSENCGGCHQHGLAARSFTGAKPFTTANNGLDISYTDKGQGSISEISSDNGKFKIPGLKNIIVTAPYMHDGRFNTLKEVIKHYNTGIQDHENLHTLLKDPEGNPIKMNLSDEDIDDMITFLATLTDQNILTNPKWSDPFKQ